MINKKVLNGIFVLLMVFGFVLSGCATGTSTVKETNFPKRPMKWGLSGIPKYTVLGPVILEKNWFGIVGFTTPQILFIPRSDLYIYQAGGITYVDILNEAKKKYPDVDAVVDINIDYSGSKYFFFFGNRKDIVSGIAIRYSRNEVDYPPEKEKKLIDLTK